MFEFLNGVIPFLAHALPFYRAMQDAGIDMVDVEGIAHYMLSSAITRMEG